ncbi:putative disease resistance RPP13-like protein 1 [Mangifera indica]|uniref:putative disease resistance RPP13-like protein 1 n=1 Tax=Mangifera indica TaxID=29780 RepID=UPI001CFBEC60|nr:putative disease resistance RPP13-like protein 1 [Mangifera indica]
MAVDASCVSQVLQVIFHTLEFREFMYLSRWRGETSTLSVLATTLLRTRDLAFKVGPHLCYEETALKLCLDDLLDLVYDVDEMVDGVATYMLGRELIAQHCFSINKVRNLIPACFTYSTPNISVASMIKDIKDIDRLVEKIISIYKFPGEASIPQRSPLVTRSGVHGRDEDKEKILKMVLSDESSYIRIGGMGGIGKTRLVQEVYNDKALEGFNIRAWVDVSYGPDIQHICKQLLQQIILSSDGFHELEEILIALGNAVMGKKFLFVLDDVRIKGHSDWELLRTTFEAGAAGSKIIVTTCIVDVLGTILPSKCYNLNLLTKDACWAIFEEHAFEIGGINPQRTSPLIREKVVEKIQGLPLAASTLGSMLRSKHQNEWESILNDKTFDFLFESEIIRVLETTYFDLHSDLKACFAYCAILPKDYEFEEKELVLLWAADGLILLPSTRQITLKNWGAEFFSALLQRSIFQPSSSNASKFRMHGFFNSLARRILGKRSFKLGEDSIIFKKF